MRTRKNNWLKRGVYLDHVHSVPQNTKAGTNVSPIRTIAKRTAVLVVLCDFSTLISVRMTLIIEIAKNFLPVISLMSYKILST